MKRLVRGLLFSGYLFATTFLLLEIAVRVWGYADRYIYDPIYMPFEKSDEISFVLKQQHLRGAHGRSKTLVDTDELRLRTTLPVKPLTKKTVGEYRIAFAGDSFTFGAGDRAEEACREDIT